MRGVCYDCKQPCDRERYYHNECAQMSWNKKQEEKKNAKIQKKANTMSSVRNKIQEEIQSG